jgi:phospholipase C
MGRLVYALVTSMAILLVLVGFPVAAPAPTIDHVVVIVQENHSFDNFFGFYPGTSGLKGSTAPIFHSATNAVYENQSLKGFVGHPENYGYFTCKDIPYYCKLANSGILFDNFFAVSPVASLPNHMAIIAGSTLGFHTDWNTSGQPFPWRSNTTILDKMTSAGVSWNYDNCNYNECPLSFFRQAPTWANDLGSTTTLFQQIDSKTLPSVSFVMPTEEDVSDQAPALLSDGQAWVQNVVDGLNSSGYLQHTIVLLTWDDSGGWYDHVTPPGAFGYRVPMIMIAPFGPKGVVDHALSSFYSVPALIESVFHLPCMHLDCSASDLLGSLSGLSSTSQASSPGNASYSVQATTSTGCQAWATAYWGPYWGCENLSPGSAQSTTTTTTSTACQAWATAYWGPYWGCQDQG